MNRKSVLLASLLTASAWVVPSAYAATDWEGTANYAVGTGAGGDEETVGPFSTYDFGSGVVLLVETGTSNNITSFNGYYQSFVTKHELAGVPVDAPLLDNTYELTVVANFTQTVNNQTNEILVNSGGTFSLYRDTDPNRDYTDDIGFTDGGLIMTGTILGGIGAAASAGNMVFGATDITIDVTSFDASVYEPDTIAAAGGIFTLRLGNPGDLSFLGPIDSVQGIGVAGNYLYAADGYATLAVPEAETYAMMLVGLGLVGFMVRRRTRLLA